MVATIWMFLRQQIIFNENLLFYENKNLKQNKSDESLFTTLHT